MVGKNACHICDFLKCFLTNGILFLLDFAGSVEYSSQLIQNFKKVILNLHI